MGEEDEEERKIKETKKGNEWAGSRRQHRKKKSLLRLLGFNFWNGWWRLNRQKDG